MAKDATKIEGKFGNSAQARHYEERIIGQLKAWGIPDGENPAKYIKYMYTEESRTLMGVPIFVPCQLCGHPIIYKQMCAQTGPGKINALRVLGCDCVVNYQMVDPSEARLMELKTAELQKAFQEKQKAARAEERKVQYAQTYEDVLTYIQGFRALNGIGAFLPRPLYDAERAIQSGEFAEKKTEGLVHAARNHMAANPIGKLADEKANLEKELERLRQAREEQEAKLLADRRTKYAKHMDAIEQALREKPGNDFFRSMQEKFTKFVTDPRAWEPTINMVQAVEKEMQRQEQARNNKGEEHNLMQYEDLINRVEALHNYTWGKGKSFFSGEWHLSQSEEVAILDDMVTKLVEKGSFASDKAQNYFMKLLEKYERIAQGRENR